MKRTKRALALCPRLPAAAKHAGLWVATVASIALVLAPLGPTQSMALGTTTSPTAASTTATAPAALPVGHSILALIDDAQFLATYLPVDAPLLDVLQLQTFRVRFHVDNATTDPITVEPQLEYRLGGGGYVVVPQETQTGEPFTAARESVSSPSGSTESPLGADIAVTDLMVSSGSGGLAVSGHHSMGLNPDVPITLPANSFTEQEFTVRLTADAEYLSDYELRITDAGAALTGTATASIRVSGRPSLPVESAQPTVAASSSPTSGASSSPTTSAAGASSSATAGASSSPTAAASSSPTAAASSSAAAAPIAGAAAPGTLRYALAPAAVSAPTSAGIHGPYSMTTDQCGACHRAHTAKGPNLLTKSAPQSDLCFTCHGGLGASLNVESQYGDSKPNVPSAREYYSHDVTAPTTHTLSSDASEFAGVRNRHSECTDCHNPHKATATDSTESTDNTGWVPSGRLAGVSGVSVVNGPANAAPTYTFLDGKTNPVTREYQLCFKCHSGFTVLPLNTDFPSSEAFLDKAQEFNPANSSFHPVEAPGTNKTDAMTNSLAASGFTTNSTIRCSNCHAGPGPNTPVTPIAAGADLAPHASANQGILLQKYRDRVLTVRGDAYDKNDFNLCFMCHAQSPFTDQDGQDPATNFSLHGRHVSGLGNTEDPGSAGTNIDTSGAGDGNAICAECHFRLHSTRFPNESPAQDLEGSRLVNFAPNVKPGATAPISWKPATATAPGSCTLTCHGYAHTSKKY